jgi:hypothetical protein
VLLRVVDEPWPFQPRYTLAPQPLVALDLLDLPDPVARRIGREVLNALPETRPALLARQPAGRCWAEWLSCASERRARPGCGSRAILEPTRARRRRTSWGCRGRRRARG